MQEIGQEIKERDGELTIPCPDPDCAEQYTISVAGEVSDTVTESCNECEKKIWTYEGAITTTKYFNIHSGDGGGNNHTDRYERTDYEIRTWKRLR